MKAAGFTLVELIVIMILLGILAAVALPRMTGVSEFRVLEFRDKTVAALRYAQKTATSHRRQVCVAFTPSTVKLSIASIRNSSVCNTDLRLPDGALVLESRDTTNAVFTSGHETDLNFSADGTSDGRTLKIKDGQAEDIVVVGATGHVQ